ncbi:MAG: stage V sporulation protein AD [Eubacteriales bacterium]|nr:stage V sporulation protein AD [Eubacteriales bacterium]
MDSKRLGQQTIELPSRPSLCGNASFVGKKEGEGPLAACFDHIAKDELYGQESFELAEKQLYLDAIHAAIEKGGSKVENVQFLLGGDLLNQIITASFSARELGIPFIGLYGACSTMSESLCLGGMLLDGGHAQQVVCAASSHFCTAERQYRYPLEFGSQRPPSAQWTVTGTGATLLSSVPAVKPLAQIARVCMGRVIDLGITDANNMGAAMAPVSVNIGPCFPRASRKEERQAGDLWSLSVYSGRNNGNRRKQSKKDGGIGRFKPIARKILQNDVEISGLTMYNQKVRGRTDVGERVPPMLRPYHEEEKNSYDQVRLPVQRGQRQHA